MLRIFEGHAGACDILIVLLRRKSSFRSELSYDVRLDRDTCGLTLKFLKELDLIEDKQAPAGEDRRKRIIKLTVKGERVARTLIEVEKALGGH